MAEVHHSKVETKLVLRQRSPASGSAGLLQCVRLMWLSNSPSPSKRRGWKVQPTLRLRAHDGEDAIVNVPEKITGEYEEDFDEASSSDESVNSTVSIAHVYRRLHVNRTQLPRFLQCQSRLKLW